MALSRPLLVAIVAMALLVGSVTFEVVVQRTYSLDVQQPGGWQTLATSGDTSDARYYAKPMGVVDTISVSQNDTLHFRLRVDNGYPWSLSEHYFVQIVGLTAAEGDITAAARGMGESTFDLPVKTLLGRSSFPKPIDGQPLSNLTSADVAVTIDEVYLSGVVPLEVRS